MVKQIIQVKSKDSVVIFLISVIIVIIVSIDIIVSIVSIDVIVIIVSILLILLISMMMAKAERTVAVRDVLMPPS